MTAEPRLTPDEIGPTEMHKVLQAAERFKSHKEARWHAERYGNMAAARISLVQYDVDHNLQSSDTCDLAKDAYNLARMAHQGWRALRGI